MIKRTEIQHIKIKRLKMGFCSMREVEPPMFLFFIIIIIIYFYFGYHQKNKKEHRRFHFPHKAFFFCSDVCHNYLLSSFIFAWYF